MLSQLTAPSELPVSVNDARRHVAITDATHDTLLLSLIQTATQWVETYLNARIMEQTVRLHLSHFPEILPIYPVKSVDAVAYDDVNGDEQTFTDYFVGLSGIRPQIRPEESWPAVSGIKPDPVRIDLTVGFESVPEPVRAAILVMVQEMFANRGDSVVGLMISPSRFTVAKLLSGYRRQVI